MQQATSFLWESVPSDSPGRAAVCLSDPAAEHKHHNNKLLLTAAPGFQQGFDADFKEARVLLAGHGCSFLLTLVVFTLHQQLSWDQQVAPAVTSHTMPSR